MEKVKTAVLVIFFACGLLASCLLMFYLVSGSLFIADSSIQYQGEIAFLPKWILLFSIFVLLAYTKRVQNFLWNLNL